MPESTVPAPPAACLLHAEIHTMSSACWDTAIDWYLNHQDKSPPEQRAEYQAAVERKMLDAIRLGHEVDHAIPPSVDRAVRRDHSLCGAHPCSDCR